MEDKILKLTSAVYSLLEFFPESDPIKNKAKEASLLVMENYGKQDISESVDLLLSYLWIAKNQRWISDANYIIIASEYGKLTPRAHSSVIPATRFAARREAGIQSVSANTLDSLFQGNDAKAKKSPPLHKITARQIKIINFLQNKEKAQVMDLQTVLPDVTKRTIRRDLDELLEAGKIARFGDFNQVFYRIT